MPVDLRTLFFDTRHLLHVVGWFERSMRDGVWRVLSAPTGCTKSHVAIFVARELHPPTREPRRHPVLLLTASSDRRPRWLLHQAADALGEVLSRRVQADEVWLAHALVDLDTRLVVVDDAHKLTTSDHLATVKLVSDLYATLTGGARFGVIFLSATQGGETILRSVLETGDDDETGQYKGRTAAEDRYVRIPGLALDDVREMLAGYEDALRSFIEGLTLVPHAPTMFEYLKRPVLAPLALSGLVSARSLRWYVEGIARRMLAREITGQPESALVIEVGEALVAGGIEVSADHDPGAGSAGPAGD